MSQLLRLVEVEVPRAIGVLNRILRNLDEYHAVRAANPRASYDDVAMAKAIWADAAEDEVKAIGVDQQSDGDAASGSSPEPGGDSQKASSPAPPTAT